MVNMMLPSDLKSLRRIAPDNLLESLHRVLIKTILRSTPESEKHFSILIVNATDRRTNLTTENITNLMFVNISGPPIQLWKPFKGVLAGDIVQLLITNLEK